MDAGGNARSWRARFVVDASGRDTFFANRMGTKKRNGRNNTAALFGHFKNVATRDGLAADAVHVWLDDRAAAAPALRRFERKVRGAIGSLSWLIYRINDPVMRDMFMAPSNRFRMREGLVSLLAGDVHRNPHVRLPVLAFKACYYGLRAARRFGWRPGEGGMVRVYAEAGGGSTVPATAR